MTNEAWKNSAFGAFSQELEKSITKGWIIRFLPQLHEECGDHLFYEEEDFSSSSEKETLLRDKRQKIAHSMISIIRTVMILDEKYNDLDVAYQAAVESSENLNKAKNKE